MEVEKLYQSHRQSLCAQVDREIALLMFVQWALAVIFSLRISQNIYPESQHLHFLIALVGGGIICSLPMYFAFWKPGERVGRHLVAIAQISFSSLFIYLFAGKPEAHFHVFCSLALLATYRDWQVLITATLATITEHAIRSFMMGSHFAENNWQWVEHTTWVIFFDVFLVLTCIRATKEMRQIAEAKWKIWHSRVEAESLNMRRTEFFSVVSHEIRTPLNGIIGFTDFLKDSSTPAEQKEYVQIIKQCSDSLLNTLNDLLDFTKIDSGRFEIDPHYFHLGEITGYLERVFSLQCKNKNIDLITEIENGIPTELFGDSHRLRQVLMNLVANALKFTESGKISVRCYRNNNQFYTWEVSDTGIGIKEDNLAKIFSPFTQEHSSVARTHGGTGLGLAISKKLVELMGGQISVRSTYGEGSLFYFTLPLRQRQNDIA